MSGVAEDLMGGWAGAIYQDMPVGVALADLDGRLLDANPAYLHLTGGSEESLRSSTLPALLERDPGAMLALVEEMRDGRRQAFTLDRSWTKQDGSSSWSRTTISLLRGDDEEPQAILITLEDITGGKKIEAVGDRLFDLSGDFICVAGMDGMFRRVSRSMSAVLGWSEEELLTRPWLSFCHEEDRERVATEAQKIMATGRPTFHFDVRALCKDGSIRFLSASGSPDLEAEVIYSVMVDVTDRERIESDRRELEKAKQRERQALEINDTIVQGLAAAKMALEMDMQDKALDLIGGTLRTARSIVTTLLSSGAIDLLHAGGLRRGGAARIDLADKR